MEKIAGVEKTGELNKKTYPPAVRGRFFLKRGC